MDLKSNKHKTRLRVSLVIPAYNEERHLHRCLDAVAAQIIPPYEVIVVDNNSTDSTAEIARSYPFVRVVSETRQGVVHARNRGFDAARGDIIARLDGDTIPAPDWMQQALALFADPATQAVSGAVHYYDVPLSETIDAVDLRFRVWLEKKMTGYVFLQGCNMAVRKTAWQTIRQAVCHQGMMHEDLDLAVHLGDAKQRVIFSPSLQAGISGRRIDSTARDFYEYVRLSPYTYARHNVSARRYMYPIVIFVLALYPSLRFAYRGYDTQTKRFSWRAFFVSRTRVNPATFAD